MHVKTCYQCSVITSHTHWQCVKCLKVKGVKVQMGTELELRLMISTNVCPCNEFLMLWHVSNCLRYYYYYY